VSCTLALLDRGCSRSNRGVMPPTVVTMADELNGKVLADLYSILGGGMLFDEYLTLGNILDNAVGDGYTDYCARLWANRLADDLASVMGLPSILLHKEAREEGGERCLPSPLSRPTHTESLGRRQEVRTATTATCGVDGAATKVNTTTTFSGGAPAGVGAEAARQVATAARRASEGAPTATIPVASSSSATGTAEVTSAATVAVGVAHVPAAATRPATSKDAAAAAPNAATASKDTPDVGGLVPAMDWRKRQRWQQRQRHDLTQRMRWQDLGRDNGYVSCRQSGPFRIKRRDRVSSRIWQDGGDNDKTQFESSGKRGVGGNSGRGRNGSNSRPVKSAARPTTARRGNGPRSRGGDTSQRRSSGTRGQPRPKQSYTNKARHFTISV
jgi:hypothetical protein